MDALWSFAMQLAAFSAVAGCMEIVLPEGKLKRAVDTLMGFLAAKLILDMVARLIGSL